MNLIKSRQNIILALLTALICLYAEPSRASVLSDTTNAMPIGTWAALNTIGLDHNYLQFPGGNSNASTQFMNQAVWDSQGRKVLFVGAGHFNTAMLHIYTESTNTWTKGAQPTTTNHANSHNAINVAGRVLGFAETTPASVTPHFYNIDTNTWSIKATGPNEEGIAHAFAYFPERDRWYYPDGTFGKIREYNAKTNTWGVFATRTDCFGAPGEQPFGYYSNEGAYSPARGEIIFGGGVTEDQSGFTESRSLCRMDANGVITVLPLAPTTLSTPADNNNHALLTVDPVSGDILALTQHGQLFALNVASNTWALIPNHATMPAQLQEASNNVAGGFVVPIDTYGVVLYFDFDSKGTWLYKHGQGSTTLPPAPSVDSTPPNPPTQLTLVLSGNSPPAPAPPPSGTSFSDLCQQSTTIFCQEFNTALPNDPVNPGPVEVIGNVSGLCANLVNDPTKECPVVENGALKFIVPSNSGAGGSGFYRLRFSDFLPGPITFGQEVFIQWRQKFSADFLATRYDGSGVFKQVIIGAANESSCASNELVVQSWRPTTNGWYPGMYHACGFSEGFATNVGASDFDEQPGGPGTICSYQSRAYADTVSPGCEQYYPDEWMTFQVGITHGQAGQNSRIRLWVGREGQPQVLAIDYQRVLRFEGAGYGNLWLLPYQTGKSESQTHQVGFVYYDNVIISHTQLPDP